MKFLICAVSLCISVSAVSGEPSADTGDWPRVSPESVGLDSTALASLDADFRSGKIPLVDSLLVLRCGSLAYEKHYPHDYGTIYGKEAHQVGPLNAHLTGPYNYFDPAWHPFWHGSTTHSMQSVTKSVASATIGAAIMRGDFKASLDTPVLHWFEASKVKNVDARKRRMTLRHVLTMTSGLDWDEEVPYADPRNAAMLMEATADWDTFVINRPMAHEPGSKFEYSSGDSALLAGIFRRETGWDIDDYARTYLFEPLGIHDYHWKRSEAGEVDTQGGLFLSASSLAKLGELYRNLGMANGKRLLAEDWVRDSLAPHSDPGGGYRYGYKWWLMPYANGSRFAAAAWGFGGQYAFIMPEDGIVAVTTAWNILDPHYYNLEILEKLRQAVKPFTCPAKAAR